MQNSKIKQKILEYSWEPWLKRPFGPFMLSLFKLSGSRSSLKKIGVDAEFSPTLWQDHSWWLSQEVMSSFTKGLSSYLAKGGSVSALSSSCEKFYVNQKKRIAELNTGSADLAIKLRELRQIGEVMTSYIWAANGLEFVVTPLLRNEIRKYILGDAEKYLAEVTFPIKKNTHALFEEALRRGDAVDDILNNYGWLKSRNAFSDGFSKEEIEAERKKLINRPAFKQAAVKVPEALTPLVSEARELVYYRTLRTDIFYELLFRARPILQAAADFVGVPFAELSNYSIHDLIAGAPVRYSPDCTVGFYNEEMEFFDRPIVVLPELKNQTSCQGTVAFVGKVKGVVKVVIDLPDLAKVNEGDILVTQMTFPSFIMAMRRAAAFVTDEGGITCHASIVAREMKKPCIIGTKIATQIFKDGDLVEVNADKGIVKKI